MSKYQLEITIEVVDDGWILTYPQIENSTDNQSSDLISTYTRQVFMSAPKLKKKIAEVLTDIENFKNQ